MKYRRYGKDGLELSILGFGVMRLPPRKKGLERIVMRFANVVVLKRNISTF